MGWAEKTTTSEMARREVRRQRLIEKRISWFIIAFVLRVGRGVGECGECGNQYRLGVKRNDATHSLNSLLFLVRSKQSATAMRRSETTAVTPKGVTAVNFTSWSLSRRPILKLFGRAPKKTKG